MHEEKLLLSTGKLDFTKTAILKDLVSIIWHGEKLGNLGRPNSSLDKYLQKSQA